MTLTRSKRVVSMLMALVMVLSLGAFFCVTTAFADSDGHWNYIVSNGKATITSYIGGERSITIPAKVGGYPVDKVQALFINSAKTNVTSVRFSNGITEIGSSLFENCTSLQTVTLPDTLRVVGADAFSGCSSLTGIVLPSMVYSIGDNAFKDCTNLYSASINCAINVVPKNIFADCVKLGNVTLPANCTEIQNGAFLNCVSLAKVNMPNTVKVIGKNAFMGCRALSGTITLPTSIKTIDDMAFYGCSSLQRVLIPNTITEIKTEAFSHCTSLNTVLIGTGLKKLGDNAFINCDNLDKVVFGGKYVRLTDAMKVNVDTTVYYSSTNKSSWNSYDGLHQQVFSTPTKVNVTGKKTISAGTKSSVAVSVTPNTSVIGKTYYFISSNTNVATIDADGNITAKTGGTTTITARTISGAEGSIKITVKPKKVTGVTAVSATTSSAQITWDESDSTVAGYIVYRSTKKSSGYKEVGTTLSNSFTDKGLTKGKTYYYRVKAYVKDGKSEIKSENSKTVKLTVSAPAPSTISAKKSKSKVAKITWGKAIGAEGYEVYMAKSANGKFTKIKTITSSSTTTTTKTGLTKGKTYYFKVRSYITVNGKKVYSNYTSVVKCKV